jgi:hypothetical protein
MTAAHDDVPWSVLRRDLDTSNSAPWPDFLPPKGLGEVTPLGHQPVVAEHLGPLACLDLKVGDLCGLDISDDFSEITYVRVKGIETLSPYERLVVFDYGDLAPDGWPDQMRLPMERLFGSVYRPTRTKRNNED